MERGFNIPRYDYAQKDEKFESWMTDLRRYGLVILDNTPPTEDGMVDFMHMIGPLRQRYHPTNVFEAAMSPKHLEVDYHSYGPVPIYAHTDTSYYRAPPRLQVFNYTDYDAPKEDTVSYFVDGFKVLEDISREDPEAYKLVTSTIVRQARRRMSVEEECDPSDLHIYEWDTCRDIPLVMTEDDGKLKQVLMKFNKHAGFPMKDQTDEHMKKWYRAILMVQNKLDDPKYHYSEVMKKGTMVVFDNHRICHGRGVSTRLPGVPSLVATLQERCGRADGASCWLRKPDYPITGFLAVLTKLLKSLPTEKKQSNNWNNVYVCIRMNGAS